MCRCVSINLSLLSRGRFTELSTTSGLNPDSYSWRLTFWQSSSKVEKLLALKVSVQNLSAQRTHEPNGHSCAATLAYPFWNVAFLINSFSGEINPHLRGIRISSSDYSRNPNISKIHYISCIKTEPTICRHVLAYAWVISGLLVQSPSPAISGFNKSEKFMLITNN